MKLDFKLLIVDDHPDSVEDAVNLLRDHLASRGFTLTYRIADVLTEPGLRTLAKREGKDYNLVIVDFNLGTTQLNGALAAARLRRELQYTDMIFYSSDQTRNLYDELAAQKVEGVFISDRTNLDAALIGLADTVIGKAVDLNHMRGIAMAEVAEMDVLMEETLERAFGSRDKGFAEKGSETRAKLLTIAKDNLANIEPLLTDGNIVDVIGNTQLFTSAQKYMALRRIAKCLADRPVLALQVLNDYDADVIFNRNTLAHAKEDTDGDGVTSLRSMKRGQAPVTIDDDWMTAFRNKLIKQRDALATVCGAINAHVDAIDM